MEEQILYSDKLIEIRNNSILLRKYYFPSSKDITIGFNEIEKIVIVKNTARTGKYRYWGTGDFIHWYPMDNQRSIREFVYMIYRRNKKVKACFTVEDDKRVTEILKERVRLTK